VKIAFAGLSGFFGLLMVTGCESLQDTAFVPLTAKLEPVPRGGAQYLVAINSSGRTLHHVHFRAYLWDDQHLFYTGGNQPFTPRRLPAMTYSAIGSGDKWEPDEAMRFQNWNLPMQNPLLTPITRVQIVGSCDEGRFRETWRITPSGQLELETKDVKPGAKTDPAGTNVKTPPTLTVVSCPPAIVQPSAFSL